jgi:AraC-like DNA-binding protein
MARVFAKLSAEEVLKGTVADLAVRCNCSLRRLNFLFREYFGLSVVAMRMELRLSKAGTMLLAKRAKVSEVAEQSGFSHVGLFTACFRKRFGLSPREWQAAGGVVPADRASDGRDLEDLYSVA